jgi:hypothetical protein
MAPLETSPFRRTFPLHCPVHTSGPALSRTPLLSVLIALFFSTSSSSPLSSVGFKLRHRWFLLALWFLVLLLNGAALWTVNVNLGQLLAVASDMVGALLTVICVVVIMRYVLTSRR